MLRKILERLGLLIEVETIARKEKALLGEILVIRGKCTREQLLSVLKIQETEGTGRRIGNLLMYNYEVSQDDIIEALDIQEYLREDRCANKSMERLEIATNNFLLQKQIFQQSIKEVKITLDRTNGII
jgi:hypothetical protein